jgi:hypothetical protein
VRTLEKKKTTRPRTTPPKRAVCHPVEISEDDADGIISQQRLKEPLISFEEHLRKRGSEGTGAT